MKIYSKENFQNQWRIVHRFQSPSGIDGSVESRVEAETEAEAIALAEADATAKMNAWLVNLGEAQ